MNRNIKILIAVGVFLSVLLSAAVILLPLPGQVPVLLYHFIGDERVAREQKNFVSAPGFAWQMAVLHALRYRVISLKEYEEILDGKRTPRGREIVLTFDDGNYSFETHAFPVLEKYKYPVTVFVVSESVKQKLHGSMEESALKTLNQTGWVSLGSHSKTHPLLSRMSDEQIRDELAGSKTDLEAMLGTPVDYLAYPSSDVDERVVRLARESGYRLAFATSYKKIRGLDESRWNITRIKISKSSDFLPVFWVKISGIYSFAKKQRERLKGFR